MEQSEQDYKMERRAGVDRRTGKMDEKYQYSVKAGFFIEMRRGDRRKLLPEDTNIYLN